MLAPHFQETAKPPPSAELARARGWLHHWGGTASVMAAAEATEEEEEGMWNVKAAAPMGTAVAMEEHGQGQEDEGAWVKEQLASLEKALVTPALPRHAGIAGGEEEGEDALMVLQDGGPYHHDDGDDDASASAASLLLGADLAMVFDDEEKQGQGHGPTVAGDAMRVAALEREMGVCKAKLAAAEERLARVEANHQSLVAWLAAWAAAGSSGAGGGRA